MPTIDRNGDLHDSLGQYTDKAHPSATYDLAAGPASTGLAHGHSETDDLSMPATTPLPVPHEEAVAVDTELARIFEALGRIQHESASALDRIHRAAGDGRERTPTRSGRYKEGPWRMTNQEAEVTARELAASEPPLTDRERHAQEVISRWGRVPNSDLTEDQSAQVMAAFDDQRDPHSKASQARDAIEKIDALRAERAALIAEAAPFEERYEQNPWPRFFLVKASGGHIHKDMNCSTCYPTTQYGWLPTLSGLTEKDAVDQEGTILCSVCYPSAPVEWTVGKAPADDTCPGSGQQHQWGGPHPRKNDGERRGFAAGNGADCPVCGTWVSVTQNGYGKYRKHRSPDK